MKIRTDFITNSSSSSFIIEKSDINKEKLINNILPNLYREFHKDWLSEEEINEYLETVNWQDENVGLAFYESSQNKETDEYYYDIRSDNSNDKDVYVVTNNCSIRFDWDVVEDVLNKNNMEWERGYCD